MTTDDKLKDENLQYDINREAAKISAFSSGKIRIIEQAKFTYFPLGKAFEKQIKSIENQIIQVEAVKGFKTRRKSIKSKIN